MAKENASTTAPSQGEGTLDALSNFIDYRGLKPFAGSNSRHSVDRCNRFLSEASCILSMLAAASEDADTLLSAGNNSKFDNRTGKVLAGALDGVASLVDLAAFLMVEGK